MRHGDLWILLFFFGLLLFNWPVLSIFAGRQPYAVFVLWALFIAAAALLGHLADKERNR